MCVLVPVCMLHVSAPECIDACAPWSPRRLHACPAMRTSCQIWLQSWRHLVAISWRCQIAIMAVPNHRLRANAPACIDAGAPCAPRRSHACVAMRTSCLIWLQSWRHLVAISGRCQIASMAVPNHRLRANAPARIDAGAPCAPRRSHACVAMRTSCQIRLQSWCAAWLQSHGIA